VAKVIAIANSLFALASMDEVTPVGSFLFVMLPKESKTYKHKDGFANGKMAFTEKEGRMLLEKKADLAAWQVVHVHEEPFDVGVLALETIDVAFVEHVFNKKMKHFKQWVENNLTIICIFCADIRISRLMVLR
jgi:predicted nuclease of predicted toxin-antitoxin system